MQHQVTTLLQQIEKGIESHGREILMYGDHPAYLYTVGNHLAGKPEFIMFGANIRLGRVLNHVSDNWDVIVQKKASWLHHLGEGAKYPVRIGRVTDALARRMWLRNVNDYLMTEAYDLFQIVMPDRQGVFPPLCENLYRCPILHG